MSDVLERGGDFGDEYFSALSKASFTDNKFKDEYGLIMKLLPPKSTDEILDIGCGKGTLGLFLSATTNCKVVFSDISSMPKDYLDKQEFIQCSMTNTPFDDNSFDKIYSLSVISHIENINQAIKEMYRISRGGILITTNNKYGVWLYKIAGLFGLVPKLQYDKTVKNLYSKSTLKKLFLKNGWKIKGSCYYGKYATLKLPFNFLKTRLMMVACK